MSKRSIPKDFRDPMYGLNKRGVSNMRNKLSTQVPHAFQTSNYQNSYKQQNSYHEIDIYESDKICSSVESPRHQPNNSKFYLTPKTIVTSGRNDFPTPEPQSMKYGSSSATQVNTVIPTKVHRPQLRVLCGGVDKTLQWMRMWGHLPILFEVIGRISQVQQPASGKIVFFLSDVHHTRFLQAIYYEIDRPIHDIYTGDLVKVVGRPCEKNKKIQVFSVASSSEDELIGVQHIAYLCDCAVKELKS